MWRRLSPSGRISTVIMSNRTSPGRRPAVLTWYLAHLVKLEISASIKFVLKRKTSSAFHELSPAIRIIPEIRFQYPGYHEMVVLFLKPSKGLLFN